MSGLGAGLLLGALGASAAGAAPAEDASTPDAQTVTSTSAPEATAMHLLSISRAQVKLSGIIGFYRETRRVLQALPGYPGLLAHDVRLRGLGTTAWTYTLWQDRQSLLEFRNGIAHTRAMMRAGDAMAAADFWLYVCPTDYRPQGWTDIDRVLAGESPCRPLPRGAADPGTR